MCNFLVTTIPIPDHVGISVTHASKSIYEQINDSYCHVKGLPGLSLIFIPMMRQDQRQSQREVALDKRRLGRSSSASPETIGDPLGETGSSVLDGLFSIDNPCL